MSRNITVVHLLSVPLESDYKHTLYFTSESNQTNYFLSKIVKEGTNNFSYQRKDKRIRYPADYDELVGCNYVMYKNSDYSSKWYYAFITKIEYISDGVSWIYIETDVIQTWLFDYTVKSSFIEREHTNNDTIGNHTYPEQLELGEYVINRKNSCDPLREKYIIVVGSTINLNAEEYDDDANVVGTMYHSVYSGIRYYGFDDYEKLNDVLTKLANSGKSDAISCMFMCPPQLIKGTYKGEMKCKEIESAEDTETGIQIPTILNWNGASWEDDSNYKPTTINGYTPRNNKLFTYPYCYMSVTNNSGLQATYKYELFNNPDNSSLCDFNIYSAITPGMSVRLTPLYYNNCDKNAYEGLSGGKYPVCNWSTDIYTNWLTQNSLNIATSIGGGLASVGAGIAMTALGGAISPLNVVAGVQTGVSGLTQIGSTIGEIYSHSLQPPQSEGNVNCGDVNFASGTLTFTAYDMSIKKEYARIIDEYFDMFGYKICRVKTPRKAHRENWWFTKTIDVNIDGAVPMEDMLKIKNCYNNGITFWCNPSNIGNYSVSNEIV